ncbi:hypothetical protein [Oceanirhabdus sp. W0125-5]|uniref:hypothetical protein n=1 Tax=Oceanirhabdus sp. W0125-5 TaxID=2999116 RepID=UPI0022F2E005|nr:hypothetical protein [Oceanirhabdus sp. W0125-5]WBW94913.1 hypothetical protein OW730_14535 [Oceanirhabdus sp. W0125-5]
MDMEKLVNSITEEVMIRIKELQNEGNEKKQRILLASSNDSEIYKSILNKLYEFPRKVDTLENFEHELDCYEDIILCGLDNRELANLALGVDCGQKEHIAIMGILKGKRIFLIEEGIEYRSYHNTANKVFFSIYKEYERRLCSYGITLLRKDNILKALNSKNVCSKVQCGCELELQNELTDIVEETDVVDFTNKKLISEADLKKMFRNGIKSIKIHKRTVLTPLAKDFIRINHINVNKVH